MATVYIQKEGLDHVNLINDTGADLAQYEFAVVGGLCLVADEAIVDGARGSFHIAGDMVSQIDTFVSGELTFATANAPVYFKEATGEFSDTSTVGYQKVGIVHTVKNSNGVVLVLFDRNATEVLA